MVLEKENDLWEEEIEIRDTSMYEKSFASDEFKKLSEDVPTPNFNENQQIFMDCLRKLEVGTFHLGKFKAFGRNFKSYYVDCFGFDVLCPLNKKEFYKWAFGTKESNEMYEADITWYEGLSKNEKNSFMYNLEKKLTGIELTVLITVNKELKVDALNVENLIKISWTWNEYGLHVFCNGTKIADYKFLNEFEKDKIRQFIIDEKCDKSTKVIFYHSALSAKGIILLPENEVKVEPRLLPDSLYVYDSYNAGEYIDPRNPNLVVDEFGNVTSMRYTQMSFYLNSSQAKIVGINCLK